MSPLDAYKGYGPVAYVANFLFLACGPAAIILLIVGQWPIALAVFFVGIPLFWSIRNSAIARSILASGIRGQLGELGDAVRTTERMLAGERPDATDEEVTQAAHGGELHPRANLDRVFELAFADRLDDGEHRISLLPSLISSSEIVSGDTTEMPDTQGGWLLVTNLGVRWHLGRDGAPKIAPPLVKLLSDAPRDAPYDSLESAEIRWMERTLVSPETAVLVVVQSAASRSFAHAFHVSPKSRHFLRVVADRPTTF